MLNFPENTDVRGIHNEFMLGENILVMPVFADGVTEMTVTLPGPTVWTHMWDGVQFEVLEDVYSATVSTP